MAWVGAENTDLGTATMLPRCPDVELKRSPIEWLRVRAPGPDERQLSGPKRFRRMLAGGELAIEAGHQLRRGAIAHIPIASDDIAGSGAKESPGKAHQSLTGIALAARALARGDRNQIRSEW